MILQAHQQERKCALTGLLGSAPHTYTEYRGKASATSHTNSNDFQNGQSTYTKDCSFTDKKKKKKIVHQSQF